MKKIIDVDMVCRCKKLSTALDRFFRKYPDLNVWRETFEWMYENNKDFECDNLFSDGAKNENWRFALHLDVEEDYYYIAVIERE